MALPTRRPVRRSLTASAAKLVGSSTSSYSARLGKPWQNRALDYYDIIGELRYASHFYARQLSRVRYFPALQKPDGSLEPIESGLPVEILNRIQDAGGGRSRLQYDYGRLMFITGEGVLFGSELDTDLERWRFLWKEEVKLNNNGQAVRLDASKQETNEVGEGYRMWNPHPRHSDEPDSPLHAVMDIAEELIILTASVRSTAVSRLTNGMTVIPTELSPNAMEPLGEEDPENNIFLADWIEHISNQIENPGSPESKVPFTLEGAYEFLDGVRHITMHDPQTDYLERELRMEAIKRMALGLDMPPEALLGMTDANHWTAKQVQHDIWRSHGMPKAEQFADDLAEAYLRPALREENYAEWMNVVISYDDSQVVISPDRTEDAHQALKNLGIGFPAYRELLGFDESMAPSEEDVKVLLALLTRNPALAGLDETDGIVPGERGPLPSQNGGPPADEGPPTPTAGREVSRQESRTASARILGAAELALLRCRELAGIRIRHKCKECAEGSPDAVVASVLGPSEVGEPLKLVQGGADGFHSLLRERGFAEVQASSICQTLEVYAARTLFEPRQPDLPAGLMAQIEKARETSDALQA